MQRLVQSNKHSCSFTCQLTRFYKLKQIEDYGGEVDTGEYLSVRSPSLTAPGAIATAFERLDVKPPFTELIPRTR